MFSQTGYSGDKIGVNEDSSHLPVEALHSSKMDTSIIQLSCVTHSAMIRSHQINRSLTGPSPTLVYPTNPSLSAV